MADDGTNRVRQLRIVVEAEDYEVAVAFFRDVLGLTEELAVAGEDGARVTILAAGRATLELANPAQTRFIDEVEVGRQVAPRIRLAFEVDDSATATEQLAAAGAEVIAAPRVTPWRSLNSRLAAPGDLQITLFQELEPPAAEPDGGGPMSVLELRFDDDPRRLAARPAHRQRLAELHAGGRLLAAGPWDDDSGALLVFRADRDGVRAIMASDPYYTTPGVTVVTLRQLRPVVGSAARA